MEYKTKSWWLESLDTKIVLSPTFTGKAKADVVVIGGGNTGLSTACHLKKFKPDLKVTILEKNFCGYGASSRNAGFSRTLFGFTKELTQMRFGKEKAVSAHTYMEEAVSYLNKIITENNFDCDYERNGYLLVATNDSQVRRLENEFKMAQKWGITGVERWSKRRLAEEFNTDLYKLAWHEPLSGLLNPVKLVREWKKMALLAGVEIYENTNFIEFEKNKSGTYTIRTTQGEIETEYLVFATSAFSINFPQLQQLQTPAFTHLIMTEPLTDEQLESINWKSRAGVEDLLNLIHYCRLTKDNRIIMGGGDITVTFSNNLNMDNNNKVFDYLESYIKKVFPQLSDIKITHRWGNTISATTDLAPVIGHIGKDKKVLYSMGTIGHGVSIPILNGRTLAELICDIETHRTEMFFVNRYVLPWPTEPIRFITSNLIRNIFRLQDRFLL